MRKIEVLRIDNKELFNERKVNQIFGNFTHYYRNTYCISRYSIILRSMIKKIIMKVKKFVGQVFDRFKVQYRLNKAKNKLELMPDKIDIQKLINSDKEYALNSILDKFLGVEVPDIEVSHQRNIDRLDLLNEASEICDDYCLENHLDRSKVSLFDILKHLKSKVQSKTEVSEDEKENKQEEK